MSSLTTGPNLSAAFIDLATYGDLESRLYGDIPKSADNFLIYEKFNFLSNPSYKMYNKTTIRIALLVAALGAIMSFLRHFKYTVYEPCDMLQWAYLIGGLITIYHVYNYDKDHSLSK
jgi:hypothetical protein